MFGKATPSGIPPKRLRIFVGMPVFGDVAPEVLEDFGRFMFHLGRRMPEIDFFLGIYTRAEQFRARNMIVEGAQRMLCDYLLMLDDDQIINSLGEVDQSESYDFLRTLLAHDKDIIGALYYQKMGNCGPVLMTKMDERGYRFLRVDELTHGLQRVDVAGGGCLLIKMRVFDHLVPPHFAPEFDYGTDVQLCRKAAEKGFEVWADTSIEIGHLKPSRTVITSRNRHQFQLEDQVPGEVKTSFVTAAVYADLLHDACAFTGYHDLAEMTTYAQGFMGAHQAFKASGGSDAEWYRQFPKERVARQVWFNTLSGHKRTMTEFILNSVNHATPQDILDFGCGIGIPAFHFAQRGHRVMAMDIQGTGTLEFLKWRVRRHGLAMTFGESPGGVPQLSGHRFDVIVAMDCLEHIAEWQRTLRELADHLKPGGVLFCNNAILDDETHAEHYRLKPRDFLAAAVALDLVPHNEIVFVKGLATAVGTPYGEVPVRVEGPAASAYA